MKRARPSKTGIRTRPSGFPRWDNGHSPAAEGPLTSHLSGFPHVSFRCHGTSCQDAGAVHKSLSACREADTMTSSRRKEPHYDAFGSPDDAERLPRSQGRGLSEETSAGLAHQEGGNGRRVRSPDPLAHPNGRLRGSGHGIRNIRFLFACFLIGSKLKRHLLPGGASQARRIAFFKRRFNPAQQARRPGALGSRWRRAFRSAGRWRRGHDDL